MRSQGNVLEIVLGQVPQNGGLNPSNSETQENLYLDGDVQLVEKQSRKRGLIIFFIQ